MPLSPDLIELALCKLRSNESVSATARALGISRQKLYRLAEKHAALKALLPTNAATATPPASNDQPRGDLTPYDTEFGLNRGEVADFCRELHRSGSIQKAARAAGVELFPRRIAPADVPKEARDHIRRALDIIGEARKPKPKGAEQEAISNWLADASYRWPDDGTIDAAELRKISARAADDFEAVQRARATVAARHRAASTTPRTAPEDPSVF